MVTQLKSLDTCIYKTLNSHQGREKSSVEAAFLLQDLLLVFLKTKERIISSDVRNKHYTCIQELTRVQGNKVRVIKVF